MESSSLFRIAVFYDGQYFFNVSNYYNYIHPKRARISIKGLHNFIIEEISKQVGVDQKLCRIVDAHYFRGRLSAKDADSKNKLYNERVFDNILMNENITTHYMPLRPTNDGGKQEKGVDVWLALEAYEQAIYKKYDALVLIACDGDYVPLVRKLNTLGTRVMLLGWDFEYTDDNNNKRTTRTSQALLEEATYYLPMHTIIDNRNPSESVKKLFMESAGHTGHNYFENSANGSSKADSSVKSSTICTLNNGYGFISNPPDNIFFHYSSLVDVDFNDLSTGMPVKYRTKKAADGKIQADEVWVNK